MGLYLEQFNKTMGSVTMNGLTQKELAQNIDEIINKHISMNVMLKDPKNEHKMAIFMMVREGYKLIGRTCTKDFKTVQVDIDDAFCVDEILQELHTECQNSINNSERYQTMH
jgi:hypothetical protein